MKILTLDYIANFKCDGQSCNSKCCKKWGIFIDHNTYSKYKRIKPESKAKEITKHIKKKTFPLYGEVYAVKLSPPEGVCPFLEESKLCSIQKTYGEEFLSKVCRTFPRINLKYSQNQVFRSLTFACPIAAEIMMNAPRDSKFLEFDEPFIENLEYSEISNKPKAYMTPLLFVTAHNILRYEALSLDERLAVLALFCESANGAKNLTALADISETFEKEVPPNAKDLLAPLKFSPKDFLKEMFVTLHSIFAENIAKSHTTSGYMGIINQMFGISILEEDPETFDYDELERIYNETYIPAKKELFEINSLQLENFALNYLYETGLPIRTDIPHLAGGIARYMFEYKISEIIFVCFYQSIRDKWSPIGLSLMAEDIANLFTHNMPTKFYMNKKCKKIKEVMPVIKLLLEV